jgi:8-oxo-dGTP pyrophosphatase MutT (NUDIX family)
MGKIKKENYRPGVFIVVYSKKGRDVEYLLLKRKLHWKGWEFPKGGIEEKEGPMEAIKRELKEESGLKTKKIKRYSTFGQYKYKKKLKGRGSYLGQNFELFSAQVKKPLLRKLKLDQREHSAYRWVNFVSAMKLLTWPNQQQCLKIVHNSLLK